MNTRIEAALMITTGALFSASAHFGPMLSERLIDAVTTAQPALAETTPVWIGEPTEFSLDLDHTTRLRVIPCQDSVRARSGANNAMMTSRDDRGGFTVSIVDGELKKIEAEGDYTLEEEGDTIRILDPDGGVAFETSKSNPVMEIENFDIHLFDNPLLASAAHRAPGIGATLGAHLTQIEDAMAAQLGIDSGVVIDFVIPGSGADAGGLQQYDVIVALGGEPVDTALLAKIIRAHEPGDTVELNLIRNGERQSIEIELGSAPSKAPAINGFRFNTKDLGELRGLHRMLEQQQRLIQPAPAVIPSNPDTIDASDMAPRNNSDSFPA